MSTSGLQQLLLSLAEGEACRELLERFAARGAARALLAGLNSPAKALYLTLLARHTGRPFLVITGSPRSAETLLESLDAFHLLLEDKRPRPLLIPAPDVLPGQGLSPHNEIKEQRAIALYRMAAGECSIAVAPVASALMRVETCRAYLQLAIHLRTGDEIPMDDLAAHLRSIGYSPSEPVEMEGEFSIRGGIFDVYPAEAERPVRIEFFGDAVESLREFDPGTQRSTGAIEVCTLLPLEETPRLPDLLAGLSEDAVPFPGWEFHAPKIRPRPHSLESLLDHPIVVWDEPESLAPAADKLWQRLTSTTEAPLPPEQLFFRWGELHAANPQRQEIELRELALAGELHSELAPLEIASRPPVPFRNQMPAAVADARTFADQGYQVVFFAATPGDLDRLSDIFGEYELPHRPRFPAASVWLQQSFLRRGTVLPEARLALIGFEDLFDTAELTAPPVRRRSHIATFTPESLDLTPGDYVVHAQHGIGRFTGLKQVKMETATEEFMVVEYAGESRLYVPLTRLDLIQKYRGAREAPPAIDKLGGQTWQKTKSRVKAKMRDMADELLKLYAQRKTVEGFAFSNDSNWQGEFEDSFEYTPTRDQTQAATEIKRDMESAHPMDRLLCGDVGFGKTEVAMRAAFKALGDGKQVAVLAPTTVLAFQHYETFRRRFQTFPVRVELLSRFRTAKEIKATLADLAAGKVDIVIGTHRLLSKDVEFPDLGLLIVDEEQRFGVRHKERLKQLRGNIDVLTMSATPIPRTLHMSLLGLRDMSVIETPPKDRLAVQTVVARYNPDLIRTAIEQELSRNGQVYFVHNRVESIWTRAAEIQALAPGARVTVGHGQMGEDALEKVLLSFMRHEADVFVCTTIVENGLDIPRANTMIIENAQNYGLSELYQLRGRVGRSNRRAYAYLLVPPDGELTEIARKRLAALKEFSDLGAGFKIAALDLELRGAGNLLGGEQHGHMASVGYETYLRMLDETARELRGETIGPEVHSSLNLGLEFRIPHEYIADEQQRLRAYKRIADCGEPERADHLLSELTDRYGTPPESVRRLIAFSRLKTLSQRMGVEAVDRRGGGINLKFHPGAPIDPDRLMRLVRDTAGAQFTPAGVLRLPLAASDADALIREVETRLNALTA